MFDLFLAAIAATIQSTGDGVSTGSVTVAPVSEVALVAEPQVPSGQFTTAAEVKPILGITQGNWISVREFDGQDLLYVTHIWSWRCGLVQMELGVNGAPPEIWPLPECHLDQGAPNGITEADGLPYRSYELGSITQIEVHLTYDDLSKEQVVFNRMGQPQN